MLPLRKMCLWILGVLSLVTSAAAEPLVQPKATTFSADLTGLWLTPSEAGWGLNIIQQSQTMFATLFIYGTNGQPLWLVGSDVTYTGTDSSGAYIFSGPLYQANGPYFGGPFNPNNVGLTQVGTMRIRFAGYGAAQLTYTVNGLTIVKNIVPFTMRYNNLAGTYLGGMYGRTASCGLPIPQIGASLLTFTISQSGTSMVMVARNSAGNSCVLTGTITQWGKLVDVDGTYSCYNGTSGAFALRRLEAGIDGLSGAYFALSVGCAAEVATIGAARVD